MTVWGQNSVPSLALWIYLPAYQSMTWWLKGMPCVMRHAFTIPDRGNTYAALDTKMPNYFMSKKMYNHRKKLAETLTLRVSYQFLICGYRIYSIHQYNTCIQTSPNNLIGKGIQPRKRWQKGCTDVWRWTPIGQDTQIRRFQPLWPKYSARCAWWAARCLIGSLWHSAPSLSLQTIV